MWILIVVVLGSSQPTFVKGISTQAECLKLASYTQSMYVNETGQTFAKTQCVQVTTL